MNLYNVIQSAESDPQKLEQLYQTARQQGRTDAFRAALLACCDTAPENVLYAAWRYRLEHVTDDAAKPSRGINWMVAVPLSILTGLIFWALSGIEPLVTLAEVPQLVIWWSPIATLSALIFLTLTSGKRRSRTLALGLGLLATAAYAVLLSPRLDPEWAAEQYPVIAAIHIPLLCWIALGISVLGFKSSVEDRFGFLIKSIEVVITAGLYLIAGVAFGGITVGLFAALSIELPDVWMRLIAAGGFGLLPVLAVATVYDPHRSPSEQDFDRGLSRFIATMMRLLLPLTLGVLVVYMGFIPFNFMAPYESRDVLIVYNLMLFAVLGLLLGATPSDAAGLSPGIQTWLRRGILAVAILAELVSGYALSATVVRTLRGSLTLNRLTIIGWNSINIGVLFLLVAKQIKNGRESWVASLQSVFSVATNGYLVWGLLLIIVAPLLLL